MATTAAKPRERARGKLKIGDNWNAITIIALSQSNPLKAIAELVENCIDASASSVVITRGREHGRHFLAIRDDVVTATGVGGMFWVSIRSDGGKPMRGGWNC